MSDLTTRSVLYCSTWSRPETFAEFIDASIALLRKLRPLHRLFREGLVMGAASDQKGTPLMDDLSNVHDWLRKHGWDHKADRRSFSEIDEEGHPTLRAVSSLGFGFALSNMRADSEDNIYISLAAVPKSAYAGGGLGIRLPRSATEFQDYVFVKNLLRVCVEHYDPDIAGVTRQDFVEAVHESVGKRSTDEAVYIDWLSYFANPRAAEVLPSREQVEPFGPGGVLLTLQRRPPAANEAMAIQHAARIHQALQPGGWLKRQSMKRG